ACLFDARTGAPAGPGVSIKVVRPGKGGPGNRSFQSFWSPDSTVVVVQDPDPQSRNLRLHLCDARTGDALASPIVMPGFSRADITLGRTVKLQFDAQGQRLLTLARAYAGSPLTGGATQEVQLWNPRTGQSLMPVLGGSRLGGIVMTATLNQAGDRIAVVVAP